uniref:Exocyst complex component 6 n=1 Tax=Schistocephalus solidus TaxID=70667 RepID=A0A183T975_SCHSO
LKELAAASIPVATDGSTTANSSSPWTNTITNIEDVVNFGPVYRCLHIYAVSGERAEFEHYYFTQRKKQCQLILSLSPSQQVSLRNYSEFFSTLVGFFLLDDYLRHTMPGAGSSYQTYLNDLWANVVPKLVQFATKNAEGCKTDTELLCLKHYSVLFEYTMANLGFHTAGLTEMLEVIRKHYNDLLIGQWRERLNSIVADDNYTAITLNSSKDLTPPLSTYLSCCTLEFSSQAYPRVLAFSPMVPKIFMAIRDYIDACLIFVENVNLSWTELEDTLSRATNSLFTECLDGIINRMITDSEKNLLRLIQLTINLNELESACEHLQAYLHENARPQFCTSKDLDNGDMVSVPPFHDILLLPIVIFILELSKKGTEKLLRSFSNYHYLLFQLEDFKPAQPDDLSMVHSSRSHLYGVSLFKDTRARSETQIYTILNARIEEFCSLATYEGIFGGPGEGTIPFDELISRPAPSPPPSRASDYMKDLTAWLGSTFSAFTNLPPKVAQTACISASKHIVRLLQNILMGPNVKMVMEPALSQFALDLAECEKFAKTEPVPGIDKSILLLIFQELSQLLDLIKKEDWRVYFTNHNKPVGNPYDRVTPGAAIHLLERIREAEKKKSSFLGSIKKEERERRKNLDKVISQLKDLSGRR